MKRANIGDVLVGDGSFPGYTLGALFLVVEAFTDSSAVNARDSWPAAFTVVCSPLTQNGEYDPQADTVRFYQDGAWTPLIPEPKFAPMRMVRTYVPVGQTAKGVPDTSNQVPSRKKIIEAIEDAFRMEKQWKGSRTSYHCAAEYAARAKGLIELLEVHDCGSIGGFDPEDPNKGKRNSLESRLEWLKEKYGIKTKADAQSSRPYDD